MGVFEYKDGKVTPKAFFGIGGDGLQEGLSDVPVGPGDAGPAGIVADRSCRLDAVRRQRSSCSQSPFETVRQLTVDGFFRGCSYGLLGVGFALILGVTGRFHFAYGFTYTLAVYLAFTFTFRVDCRSGRRPCSACC